MFLIEIQHLLDDIVRTTKNNINITPNMMGEYNISAKFSALAQNNYSFFVDNEETCYQTLWHNMRATADVNGATKINIGRNKKSNTDVPPQNSQDLCSKIKSHHYCRTKF